MSDLFGLLGLGSGAIAAQNAGIAVTGRNTANVNTEGYQREKVDLLAEDWRPGGVRAGDAYRTGSELLSSRERLADGLRGHSSTRAAALEDLENQLLLANGDIVRAIADLFGGAVDLASAPTDSSLRAQFVSDATSLAAAFARAGDAIHTAIEGSDARIADISQQATQLAQTIADANRTLSIDPDPVIADERDLAARKLSELIGGQARIDADGKMRFVVSGGVVLVDGDRAAQVKTTADVSYQNHLRVDIVDGVHVVDVTQRLDGGKLAGELSFRDQGAPQAAADLDALAYDMATQINAVHRANAGLDGVTGRDLFVEPTSVSGAARQMAVEAAVRADPTLVATAASGAGLGDNSGMLALVDLRDQTLAGGGTRTFVDEGIRTLGAVGSATASATSEHSLNRARTEVLSSVRDSVSGVSLQEEMANLAAFQHASQAATRFVATVNDLLGYLVNNL